MERRNTAAIDGSASDNNLAWKIDHSYELVLKAYQRQKRYYE